MRIAVLLLQAVIGMMVGTYVYAVATVVIWVGFYSVPFDERMESLLLFAPYYVGLSWVISVSNLKMSSFSLILNLISQASGLLLARAAFTFFRNRK